MTKDIIPDLKKDAIQWHAKFSSGSENASTGYITKYATNNTPRGNLVLIPGMASNCKTEPLMQAFIAWGLLHKYNIYTLETFLGRFQPNVNINIAQKNTVPELINLIDRGLTMIEKYSTQHPIRIVAHSAGAVGSVCAINRQIAQSRLINIDRITLFAPFVSDERFNRIKKIYRGRLPDAEFQHMPIRIENPFMPDNQPRCISVLPAFFEQMANLDIAGPEIEKYTFPVTIVAGGRDNKVTANTLYELYKKLTTLPNGHLFNYVLLSKSNHSFTTNSSEWFHIISRINPFLRRYNMR